MPSASLIPPSWQLPEEFRQRLGTSVGRQRLMQSDGQILLVLHEVPDREENVRRGVLFWRDQSNEWRASNGERSSIAIGKHLSAYQKKIEEYDLLEAKAQCADEYLRLLEGLSPIVRATRHQLQVFEDARQAIPSDRTLIDHRDTAYELSRNADLLYDEAKNSMEVAVVRRAEEQAHASQRMVVASHRLNVLVALFFPTATLGAALGTTLTDNWTWSNTQIPFAIFIGVSLLFGIVLQRFVTHTPIGKS